MPSRPQTPPIRMLCQLYHFSRGIPSPLDLATSFGELKDENSHAVRHQQLNLALCFKLSHMTWICSAPSPVLAPVGGGVDKSITRKAHGFGHHEVDHPAH